MLQEERQEMNLRRLRSPFFLSLPRLHDALHLQKKVIVMLTLDFLQNMCLPNADGQVSVLVDGISKASQIMESRAGLDGIIELIQHKGPDVSIVLEHSGFGRLSLRNCGGFHEQSQSVWVVEMVGAMDDETAVMQRCMSRVLQLYGLLLRHVDDTHLCGWIENNDISYYPRNAGSYVGYEMMVNFKDVIDLSYHEQGN